MRVKRAGDAGDRRAEPEGQQLDPHHVDAHHLGGGFVLMDRIHGAAEARAFQPRERTASAATMMRDARIPACSGLKEMLRKPCAPPT